MTGRRKKHEDPAAEFSQQLAAFFDTVPVMVRLADADGNEIWFNRAWLEFTGKSLEEQTQGRWMESVHPDDLDRVRKGAAQVPEPHQQFRMRFRLCRHDGQYR